jgi:hypothetical protein
MHTSDTPFKHGSQYQMRQASYHSTSESVAPVLNNMHQTSWWVTTLTLVSHLFCPVIQPWTLDTTPPSYTAPGVVRSSSSSSSSSTDLPVAGLCALSARTSHSHSAAGPPELPPPAPQCPDRSIQHSSSSSNSGSEADYSKHTYIMHHQHTQPCNIC